MLVVNGIGPGVVPYFLDGRHPGRWTGSASRLLGVGGPVDAVRLRRLLQGRDPASGRFLPDFRPHRRRGGWDLVFAAPKSVSLLHTSSAAERSAGILAAHVAAVEGVVRLVEERLQLRRQGPDGTALRAEGLLGAAFDHELNAASEPHLHTHVLVANLSCSGGVWGSVWGGEWFVGRSALAALYQLELRDQLERSGWRLEWRLRPDGLADLAEIPRAAVRAASTQSRLAAAAGRFPARAGAEPQPWRARVAAAAPDGGVAAGGPERSGDAEPGRGPAGRGPANLDDPALARAVTVRLTVRRSDFRVADVVVALAACHARGAGAAQSWEWAQRFCAANRPVPSPTTGRRWTTEAARQADERLSALLDERRERAARPVDPAVVDHVTARAGLTSEVTEQVRALTAGPAEVHFLGAEAGRTALLGQAEVLAACRDVWARAGKRVAVTSPTADGALRWRVLAGLAAHRPGERPDVLVVDRADRMTTSELTRLAAGTGARLIFVEGGTLPRLTNPASHGLVDALERAARQFCPPPAEWTPARPGEPPVGPEGLVGRAAAAALLAGWYDRTDGPLLVGLGLEEVGALNRAVLGRPAGRPDGPRSFEAGDRVVVLRGRPGLPPYATFGTVTWSRDAGGRPTRARQEVRIAWADGSSTTTADRRVLAAVGFGYAATPWLAARTSGPLMVLGPADALGRARDRVVDDVTLTRSRDRHRATVMEAGL